MEIIQSIQHKIYVIRGEPILLDFDLAELYEVPTKVLNQSVKRHSKRFPDDFMFQLTAVEWRDMRSQFVTSSQIKRKHSTLPYAFTEQGVAMLSGVLNSDRAINMNISIMRVFVEIRSLTIQKSDVKLHLQALRDKLDAHDVQLSQIYDAIENLLDERAEHHKWSERERIGFKTR